MKETINGIEFEKVHSNGSILVLTFDKTDENSRTVIGRNGYHYITKMRIVSYHTPITTNSDIPVLIEGVGKRGSVLNAGFQIQSSDMDTIAQAWLKVRGKL